MSSMAAVTQSAFKKVTFREKSENFNKQCAVLLGFTIPISTMGTNLLLLAFLFSWFLAGNLREKVNRLWKNPIAKMALLLFSLFLVGITYTEAPREEVMHQLDKYVKLLYIPFVVPLMNQKSLRNQFFFAFLGAMLLTYFFSLLKIFHFLPAASFTKECTGSACVFKDHIYTNLMMAMAAYMVGCYVFLSETLSKKILFSLLYMAFFYYVFFLSQGRIGYVIFIILSILFLLAQRVSIKGVLLGVIVSALTLGVSYSYSSVFKDRVLSSVQNVSTYYESQKIGIAKGTTTSEGARLGFYRETLELAKKHLWFGYGTGSFREIYKAHAAEHQLYLTSNPHNEFLNILFQLGLFGLAGWLSFLGIAFWKSFMLPKPERYFAQGMLIAMVTGCFLNSWLMDFTSGYLFVWMMAVTFGAFNNQQDKQDEPSISY